MFMVIVAMEIPAIKAENMHNTFRRNFFREHLVTIYETVDYNIPIMFIII